MDIAYFVLSVGFFVLTGLVMGGFGQLGGEK